MYVAILCVPLVPVFFYGMFTESIPLFNSRRKNYIILMSIIQTLTLLVMAFTILYNNINELVALMFLNEFCLAVNGTIADGLLVT